MLKAYLHNKVPRELVRREDVVTSCVFGTLEAVGEAGLDVARRFLARARLERKLTAPPDLRIRKIDYEFWPWLTSPLASAEPDVLLTLEHDDGSRSLVAIEAKLDSGKSSEASEAEYVGDQLAREWMALRATASSRAIQRCTLIYLTTDVGPPDDIASSRIELEKKHPDLAKDANILWLSWRDLPELITPDHGVALGDMSAFLVKEHLTYFAGFTPPPPLPAPWRFEGEDSALPPWTWPLLPPLPTLFAFTAANAAQPQFTWPQAIVPAPFRFDA